MISRNHSDSMAALHAELTGAGQKYKGCSTVTLSLGDSECAVAYDYQREEPMVWRYADGSGYPGRPAVAEVVDVWINGGWLGDVELISESVRNKWEEQIIEHEDDLARDRMEDRE